MSWKVSVLVNDETVDPTADTYLRKDVAKQEARRLGTNAAANGFARDTVADWGPQVWYAGRDGDGDRVTITIGVAS